MLSRSHIASMSPVRMKVSFSPLMGACAYTVVSRVFGRVLEKIHARSRSFMRDAMSLIFASIVALENFRSLGAGLPGAHEAATTVKIKLKQQIFIELILNRLHKFNDLFKQLPKFKNAFPFRDSRKLKTGFKGGKWRNPMTSNNAHFSHFKDYLWLSVESHSSLNSSSYGTSF